jgi:hypothetical protein
MQTLFGIGRDTNPGIVSIPEWNYVRLGLIKNLDTTTGYYRRYPLFIDSAHFLIKLIYSAGIYRAMPIDRYYAYLQNRAMGVAMANKMTTSISKGEIFDGVFYGRGTKEVIIGTNDEFDFYEAERNWEDLRPIRILHHPRSDLNLNVPDGTQNGYEEGAAVIEVNIPMLVIQYRKFRLIEEQNSMLGGESPRSPMQFLFSYPLTNALYSHLDCAVFNRLYNFLVGAPNAEAKKKHPFYLTDYSDSLNRIQLKQLDILKQSKIKSFDGLMRTIPMVDRPTLAEMVELPDVAPTRQVVWGLALSRLQVLSFLFRCTGQNPRVANGAEVNRIVLAFQRMKTDQALKSSLPLDLYFDAKQDIDTILKS